MPPHPLSAQCRHHLFLAVHEAFTNILKHSGATAAKLAITCDSVNFEIIVSDAGKGYKTDVTGALVAGDPGVQAPSGNGLRNMRERLAKLGGLCEVKSAPGQGTTVRFVLPLSQLSPKGNPS